MLSVVVVVILLELHFTYIKSSEGIYPIAIVESMGWLGEPAVLFAKTDWQVQRCKWKHTTYSSFPSPPLLYFIKGIHGLVDMVLGTSTSRLFRLKAARVFCNPARTQSTQIASWSAPLQAAVCKSLLPPWPPMIPRVPSAPTGTLPQTFGNALVAAVWWSFRKHQIFALVVLWRHNRKGPLENRLTWNHQAGETSWELGLALYEEPYVSAE